MNNNFTVTLTSGTPVHIATGMTHAQLLAANITPSRVMARALSVQMREGSTGTGFVMMGIIPYGRVPSNAASGDVSEVLAPSPGGPIPGGQLSWIWSLAEGGIDVGAAWIDSTQNDKITFSYDLKQ